MAMANDIENDIETSGWNSFYKVPFALHKKNFRQMAEDLHWRFALEKPKYK